jgi:hypothetical protein
MSVFVVHDLVRVRPLRVRADHYEVFFLSGLVNTRGMRTSCHFPECRNERLHGVFVFHREDNHRFAKIHAQLGEGILKDFADLLEFIGDLASMLLAVSLMTVK